MKFYIASSFQNKELVKFAANHLKENGFTHTYDWTVHTRAKSFEELSMIGEREKRGVLTADFLLLILPGGKGSHIEMGMALASGKRVFLYSHNEDIYDFTQTSTFYFLPNVNLFVGELSAFLEYVIDSLDGSEEKLLGP